jgi:hypothetical protein
MHLVNKIKQINMEDDLYDEFGNYIGPELDNMVLYLT